MSGSVKGNAWPESNLVIQEAQIAPVYMDG